MKTTIEVKMALEYNAKLDTEPARGILVETIIAVNPLQDLFKQVNRRFVELEKSNPLN